MSREASRRSGRAESQIYDAPRVRPGRILYRAFYDRETELVSRDLLGRVLESETPQGKASGIIVETEAYLGGHDEACHAVAGRTARTAPLYGRPGTAYVYFIYGMYWCFNAVTREEGLPSAVLVRAIEPLHGIALMRRRRAHAKTDRDLTNGPGKLCAALGIGREMNGVSLQRGPLVIRAGRFYDEAEIEVTPRVGITRSADWPLRWIVKGNPYVSRGPSAR